MHDHQFEVMDSTGLYNTEYAPTRNGGHTAFIVMYCACGAVDFFPRSNYLLTSAEYRASLMVFLQMKGKHVLTDAEHAGTVKDETNDRIV